MTINIEYFDTDARATPTQRFEHEKDTVLKNEATAAAQTRQRSGLDDQRSQRFEHFVTCSSREEVEECFQIYQAAGWELVAALNTESHGASQARELYWKRPVEVKVDFALTGSDFPLNLGNVDGKP